MDHSISRFLTAWKNFETKFFFSSKNIFARLFLKQMKRKYPANGGGYKKPYKTKYNPRSRVTFGRALPPETKYFDVSCDAVVIGTADSWAGTEVAMENFIQNDGTTVGAYTDSALIPSAVGTGYGEIIGTRYRLKQIRVRGVIRPDLASDQADVPLGAVTRLVLVMDTNCNATQAQGENIFTDFATDIANVNSFLNMGSTAGKFRILKDIRFVHNSTAHFNDAAATGSICQDAQLFSFSWRPKTPLVVTLAASSSTPNTAQLQSHNIFLLALHSSSISSTISLCSRAYYCG